MSKARVKIPFSQPVRTYTAVELAKMPLSEMRQQVEAQEKHFLIGTKMGTDALYLKNLLESGGSLYAIFERGHTRYFTEGKKGDLFWPPRIVRQLESRKFLKTVKLTKDGEV